jgi:hypothetical protein
MQHTTRFLTAAAVALITGSALAVQPQTENAPLRGPKVQDAGKPDRSAQPADEMAAQKKIEMPFMAYVAALRTLQRGEDESLRMTPEQAEQIRAINQEHRAANEQYMEEHREELAKLRAASGERGPMDPDARPAQRRQGQGQGQGQGEGQGQDGAERPAARPQERPARNQEGGADRPQRNRDGMQPENADAPRPSPEERAKAAERMREIMLNAPGDAESKKKLMNVLTKPQIERIEVAIEAQRQRIREGRPPIADQPQRPAGQEGRRPANPDAQRPGQTGERPASRPAREGGDD